jgi:hypothetical protein
MKKNMKQGKVMFSEVSGRVLLEGRPLARKEIRQSFNWLGADGGDVTTCTDDNGYYRFPTLVSYEKQPKGEKDIFINQRISTIHDDRTVVLWSTTKYEFEDRGESGGFPVRMVHELTSESRTYEIPGLGPYRTSIDGVLELDHPYVEDLERGKALVNGLQEELTRRWVSLLNTPELLELINRQFVDPLLLPHAIEVVETVREPAFSSFSLYRDAGHTVPTATDYRYIGFTLDGKLTVRDVTGEAWEVPVYWPRASLSLEKGNEVPPQLEGEWTSLTIYPRDLHRESVRRYLQREEVADLVYELVAARPTTELAYMMDHRLKIADLEYDNRRLRKGYEPEYRISDFTIASIEPSFVKVENNYISVKVTGRFAVDGHAGPYPFKVFFCLSLSSLGQGHIEHVENSDCQLLFVVPTFEYALRMDQPEVSAGDPVIMHFTTTNLLPKTNVFLKWHTPFEGFMNEFLDIVHLESGETVEYEGMLASRAAPSRKNGSYIEIDAEASRSTTIDLREAYTFSRPGTYRVKFRELGGRDDEAPASTEFVLKEPAELEAET